MPGFFTNGLPLATTLTGYELLPADTERTQGVNPASVAVSVFQIAALGSIFSVNTATSTANTATLNTLLGRIITEALTTAAGADYTMTLTNSAITAASTMQVSVYSGTNTTPGLTVRSVTPAAGSAVILIRNNGVAALNGTIIIAFEVVN